MALLDMPVEIFRAKAGDLDEWADEAGFDTPTDAGWYFWVCWPGCLPDTPPDGPFDSKEAAEQEAVLSFMGNE